MIIKWILEEKNHQIAVLTIIPIEKAGKEVKVAETVHLNFKQNKVLGTRVKDSKFHLKMKLIFRFIKITITVKSQITMKQSAKNLLTQLSRITSRK